MRSNAEYRVVLYDEAGCSHYVYPERPEEDNLMSMVELLEHLVESGYACGGHIEELVLLAGQEPDWVVSLAENEVWR